MTSPAWFVELQTDMGESSGRRYLMARLLNGWTNVHPSNTEYILKNKFDQFQIFNGWVNYELFHQIPSMTSSKKFGVQLLRLFKILACLWENHNFSFFGHFSNVISLANIDFWEKSFCAVVSTYKCFNMTWSSHTSEIHQPTLIVYDSL